MKCNWRVVLGYRVLLPTTRVEYKTRGNVEDEYYYDMDNELHRVNGPAVIRPGLYQAYYEHGNLHRIDGPAVLYGSGKEEYWLHGMEVTLEEFEEFRRKYNEKFTI